MEYSREALFYNAVALHLHGDYRSLQRIKTSGQTWEDVFTALSRSAQLPDPSKEADRLQKENVRLILQEDPAFPPLLREIPHCPFGLYVKGRLCLEKISVAVVGTRRCSPAGKSIAQEFSQILAKAGCVIVSGLALGADAAAHEGAIKGGATIAVLANGLDSVYPHTNQALASNILAHEGALLSEYPLGENPLPYRFLERNRIVSGLAQALLLIEAPVSSGALTTARFALEQNRDVFVIPGNIQNPNYKGANDLIRQGATLVTSPEHILEEYGLTSPEKTPPRPEDLSFEESLILNALRSTGGSLDVDKIIDMTKLESQIVNQALTFLLLKNFIKEMEGRYTI